MPNAGSLLNFEEDKKVNILPVQVPDDNELINGVSGLNGEKIVVKGFQFDGQTNGFTNEQLTKCKDLIKKAYLLMTYRMRQKEFKIFTEMKVTFFASSIYSGTRSKGRNCYNLYFRR